MVNKNNRNANLFMYFSISNVSKFNEFNESIKNLIEMSKWPFFHWAVIFDDYPGTE